jgi:hypothetical protein
MKQTPAILRIAHAGAGGRVIFLDETGEKIDGDVQTGIIVSHL